MVSVKKFGMVSALKKPTFKNMRFWDVGDETD
jgi:hypothetical protein